MKREAAVITVYVSLVFLLLISFTGVLLESASVQTSKNGVKTQTNLALESCFAEYDPDLQEQYHLFAIDEGREGDEDPEGTLINRLRFYRADTKEARVGKIQYLSDRGGQALYEQALVYMRTRMRASAEDAALQAALLEEKEKEQTDALTAQLTRLSSFAAELAQTETEDPAAGLFALFAGIIGRPSSQLVMPQGQAVSPARIDTGTAASKRDLRSGHGSFAQRADTAGLGEEMFDAYLLDVMGKETDGLKDSGLSYEIEYIVAGKPSDRENLEETADRILMIRMAFNHEYLKRDAARQAEAAELAAFLSTVLLSPESEPALQEAITFIWAYGESLMDVRTLLAGKKVPLHKDASSWTLTLGGLFSFERSVLEGWESRQSDDGWEYGDYLRILLSGTPRNTKCMRALDLIEVNLTQKRGRQFRADAAVCRAEIDSTCTLPRSVRYSFTTAFGYR